MTAHPAPQFFSTEQLAAIARGLLPVNTAPLTSMQFAFTSPTEFNDLVYALMGRDPALTLEEAITNAEYAAAATDSACAPDAEGDRIDYVRNRDR